MKQISDDVRGVVSEDIVNEIVKLHNERDRARIEVNKINDEIQNARNNNLSKDVIDNLTKEESEAREKYNQSITKVNEYMKNVDKNIDSSTPGATPGATPGLTHGLTPGATHGPNSNSYANFEALRGKAKTEKFHLDQIKQAAAKVKAQEAVKKAKREYEKSQEAVKKAERKYKESQENAENIKKDNGTKEEQEKAAKETETAKANLDQANQNAIEANQNAIEANINLENANKKAEEYQTQSKKGTWMPSMPNMSMPSMPNMSMPSMPSMPNMSMPNMSMPSMPSMPTWSSSVNQPTDLNGNIELEINEKDFNPELKRVNIEVFIPRDAQVVVRDYAKNNATETLNNISTIGL